MITKEPTPEILGEWKSIWMQYKDILKPNRKSGQELLEYLQNKYILTEIHEKRATDAIIYNVTMNKVYEEKLPEGKTPIPRAFYLENAGNGEVFYRDENKDSMDIWGGDITKIFVGIDEVTGFFMVEGSTMLWDEMCAFCGVDEKDLQNFVCVAEYINALKRFDLLKDILPE
ncbi:hypothetical protein [Acetivibrio mesophilus]|uniref:Uncharacterized protein n=1 Tax=Acetivibrio mesophilus TaxID=2487273 RepID=A0A4Q0I6G7_9FIRM|nr:hypothetical protein [Acetivibrio mesophilus]ODM25015.1 hypothetical protein A7W90_01595 [Clostridium sp. Bc-iso-3]RXE59986.1 hypothetical protein EFD62_04330 [Acetivibrio mesophilus]